MKIKTAFLFLFLLTGLTYCQAQKQKHLTITFKYQFVHDEGEGKMINTRLKVYVDDAVKGVSLEKKEAEANHVTVEIPEGHHKIRAVIESQYEGNWEEHTIANEYSIDCIYLHEDDYKKHVRVDLIFDIVKGTIVKDVQHSNGPFNSTF
jgi:hypothetical protein